MRSALVLALLLAACATPAGRSVGDCDASWRDVESVVVRPGSGGTKTETVPIDCMRRVDQKRVRIGFSMPPGPACYTLSGVDVVEAADAVSIALWVTAIADPAAGACPQETTRTATEIDLEAPVADRSLLDGSAAD
jgi:hypothetical protein